MIEFLTNPKGAIASGIFDVVKDKLGIVKAGSWMFTANTWLDGRTPIQAIREGDHDAAQKCADRVEKVV